MMMFVVMSIWSCLGLARGRAENAKAKHTAFNQVPTLRDVVTTQFGNGQREIETRYLVWSHGLAA